MIDEDEMLDDEFEYHNAAAMHLDATIPYLTRIMGRSPTDAEVVAVWSTWLRTRSL